MKPRLRPALALLAVLAAPPAPVLAQTDKVPPPPQVRELVEPAVQRTVIEDEGSRIEELRVRGRVQRISVKPKVGPRAGYEIIPGDALREPPEGGGNDFKGTAGKRVWNVLSF